MKPNIDNVMRILKKEVKSYQVPVVDFIKIQTGDIFKVLIATLLSARTNDKTTTAVCKKLFAKVKKAEDFNALTVKQIEKLIYPVGFYKTKAVHLKNMPKALESFNGKIPKTIDELITLPGVGRKTANLVLAVGFNIPAICVDVHVHRINNRLGYVKTKNPLETEMTLRKKLPKKHWLTVNKTLVAFGQHLCKPINPMCNQCPIYSECKRIGVKTKYKKIIKKESITL